VLTGGMHLDALADTADALGGWTRERRLAIMRDHAIGAFGAVALVLTLLLEASLLATLAVDGNAWRAFAAAGACSRVSSLPLAAALPYAREEGQGAALARGIRWRDAAAGVAVAGGLALAAAGLAGLAALVATLGLVVLTGAFFRSWIGGVTGDTLGATVELAQLVGLVVLVVAL
jgi:adenosylcobinamide-GDP ribazoletransferase